MGLVGIRERVLYQAVHYYSLQDMSGPDYGFRIMVLDNTTGSIKETHSLIFK